MVASVAKIKQIQETAELLVDMKTLEATFDRMAQEMTAVLADQNPIFVCVMNGGLPFMAELLKRCHFPLRYDYVQASRYHGKTTGDANLQWKRFPSLKLKDEVVVIIDDILDVGVTLAEIVEYAQFQKAKHVYTAVMLDKPEGRDKTGLAKADFTGLEIPNRFVFGFGLDYDEYLRNAQGIYAVAKELL